MANFNKVKSDSFKSIQKGAGNILREFDVSGSKEIADSDIICATTGGVQIDCIPTYVDYGEDIDNCPKNTKELKEIQGWECKIAFTALDCTPEMIRLALGAADVSETKKVKGRDEVKAADFSDIWWVGPLKGGGWAAACLKNALGTSGFSLKTSSDGKGNVSVELTGHYSINDTKSVPMEFYSSVVDNFNPMA